MDFNQKEVLAVSAILSVILFFCLYYFLTWRKVFNKLVRLLFPVSISAESEDFISDKLTGIVFAGVLPLIVFVIIPGIPAGEAGLTAGEIHKITYHLTGLFTITILSAFFSSKSIKVQRSSPELRIKVWHPRHIILSSLSWLIYLFGYELFFRGILWFFCFRAFGFWWSVLINVSLYSLVHVPKGRLVTYGAVPLGVLFCTLSYYTGSFLPAFMIHSAMAISTELFSVYHNPEFRFSMGRSVR
jgi:membrane protease YdiL (CAAX protease family)